MRIDRLHDQHFRVYYFHVNKEGERICDFLIDTDCCILNGRNCAKNDYTFIGSQGSSVVDYCFVPYESLDNFSNFRVTSESDLFNSSKLLGTIEPEPSHPDHSLLMWDFFCWTMSGKYQMLITIRMCGCISLNLIGMSRMTS